MNTKLRITIIFILVAITIVALGVVYSVMRQFHYEKHLDETILTVDGNEITLAEFGYYVYQVEDHVQKQALVYDPDNPGQWWNTHFSAGMDSAFVCDYAKETAVEMCICDEIYRQEAVRSGLTLTSEEELTAASEGLQLYDKLSTGQRAATGLTKEMVVASSKKKALASKYASVLSSTVDWSSYSDEPETLLNWDGDYYQQTILPKHAVIQNDKLLEKITFGKITVNNE